MLRAGGVTEINTIALQNIEIFWVHNGCFTIGNINIVLTFCVKYCQRVRIKKPQLWPNLFEKQNNISS